MASISKRKDGTWLGQVNKNGKRKSFYGKTKKEVEKKIHEYTQDVSTYGVEIEKTNTTLSEWIYKHLFTDKIHTTSASTFERSVSIYNSHFKDSSIGDTILRDIKTIHLQEFINEKTDLSKSTMLKIKQLLNSAFISAINNNMIRINPVSGLKLPNSKNEIKEIEILTREEQNKYVNALRGIYRLILLTALYTGMRMGELLALKWENVDLDGYEINVVETSKRVKKYNNEGEGINTVITKKPKTSSGERIIPLPMFIVEMLVELKKDKGYVFITSDGTRMSDSNLRRANFENCKRAGIRNISLHALRHTYATRLIENGVDIKTVSELLGHSSVEITLNTYVHSSDTSKRSAVDTLSLETH